MQRAFSHSNPSIPFEFNDEDSVGHRWGDFCMNYDPELDLIINGQKIHLSKAERKWIFFHRDSDGRIDHLFPISFDNVLTMPPSQHIDRCPLCSEDIPNA